MTIHIITDTAPPLPLVSVIIPLYNKAPYIKRALDSVLAQTVQDFEIVVVGGNSSDGGEDIVKGYTDSRIQFIQEAGKGVSAARNQGVDAAKAELVAFLDADDEWLPEFLETILRLREKWPEAGLYGTGYVQHNVNKNSVTDIVFEIERGERIINNYFQYVNLFGYGVTPIMQTSAMAIPKSVYQNLGGFPVSAIQNEDRYLRARIALNYSTAYSPTLCSIYHLDNATYTARFRAYQNDSFSEYVDKHHDTLIHHINWKDIREFCDAALCYMSISNLQAGNDSILVRKDLVKIKSGLYIPEKFSLFLMTYLPNSLHRLGVIVYYRIYDVRCIYTKYRQKHHVRVNSDI